MPQDYYVPRLLGARTKKSFFRKKFYKNHLKFFCSNNFFSQKKYFLSKIEINDKLWTVSRVFSAQSNL